jgi:tRNA threonylcarbamoyl adenosine modification protein YeaZ
LRPDIILAFDTSAAHCAAALLFGDRVVTRVEAMAKGQAERLVPMLEEMLAEEGLEWGQIGLIGVGTGPGNFTGIRISVALARGLALGLKVPAIGVTGFDAVGESLVVAIPAPRGQVYVRRPGEVAEMQEAAPDDALNVADLPVESLVTGIARMAQARATSAQPRPTPFYLRPADAAPASDPPPVILP